MAMFDPVIYACLAAAQLIKLINELAAQHHRAIATNVSERYI